MPDAPATMLFHLGKEETVGQNSRLLLGDGTIMSWGNDMFGQLGSSGSGTRGYAAPVLAAGGPIFAATASVSAGGDHGILLTTANEVWVWGTNENGELANGVFGPGLLVTNPLIVDGL